ncbi:MAG: pirin family protein, partial [Hyphomicrobiales bacterium]
MLPRAALDRCRRCAVGRGGTSCSKFAGRSPSTKLTAAGATGHWHFSFDRYRDPEQTGIRALRVFDDDRIIAGTAWPMHPHQDIESLTYVVEGHFLHADSPRLRRHHIAVAHGHWVTGPEDLHRSWLLHHDDPESVDADYIALGHWDRAVHLDS